MATTRFVSKALRDFKEPQNAPRPSPSATPLLRPAPRDTRHQPPLPAHRYQLRAQLLPTPQLPSSTQPLYLGKPQLPLLLRLHAGLAPRDPRPAWSNTSLQRLLSHFSVQRSDKCKYRQSIQIHWNLAIPAIYLNKVDENYLHQIEIMAKKWSNPQDALTLVTHMAIKRKEDTKNKQQYTQHHGGRGVAKQLIIKDWINAKLLLQSDANEMK
ncbi:hypothetical protein MMC22_000616 [Lobaria immixta]|nr:hypothetical protein [Lobaria immixta]